MDKQAIGNGVFESAHSGRVMVAAAAAVAMAGLASSALAQPAHRFDKPIHAVGKANQPEGGRSQVHVEMSQNNDGDEYSVTIDDGEVSAKHNGKPVPQDRLRQQDGKIEILDGKGNVLSTFHVGNAKAGPAKIRVQGHAQDPDAPQPGPAAAIVVERPKVMIGITMADPPDSILEHLKLEPNTAIQLDRVIEGLPAAKAGLLVKDIVIELDGVRPLTQDKFREILKKKNPGDKVDVKVLRKGETKNFTMKLDAWDDAKLGVAQPEGNAFAWGGNADEAKKLAEEAMKNAQKWKGQFKNKEGVKLDGPEWREHLDMLKKLQDQGGHELLFNFTPDQFQMFTPMDAEGSKRVEERLKKVEDRLDKLADRLEKLADLLEKQQGKGR